MWTKCLSQVQTRSLSQWLMKQLSPLYYDKIEAKSSFSLLQLVFQQRQVVIKQTLKKIEHWKLSEFEIVRSIFLKPGNCQNRKMSELENVRKMT